MARFVYPTKGSPEAFAWAAKMQAARAKKKASIRSLGKHRETQFFGKGRDLDVEWMRKHGKINPGGPFDKDAARELELYGENNVDLYRQMETPIRLNLEKKYLKGTYQPTLAVKLWQHWADEAAKRYNKEYGGGGSKWFEMFSPLTRLHVAKERETFHRQEMELGNFQVKTKQPAKNPKGYMNIDKSGFHRGQYVGYGDGTWKIVKYGKRWLASEQNGTRTIYADSMGEMSEKLSALAAKKSPAQNPGQKFNLACKANGCMFLKEGLSKKDANSAATSHMNMTGHDVAIVSGNPGHRASKPKERRIPRERIRKNPLAVFGLANPPKRVNAGIAGVVYSRCLEIRAEKLVHNKGLYKHPFSKKSGVQILALDNGDLLVHSTCGVNLWEPSS